MDFFNESGSSLKYEEVLVICRSLTFAVIIEPFLSTISKDLALNGVERLFCFGCLTITVSPILMGNYFALESISIAFHFVFHNLVIFFYLSIPGNSSLWCL